MTAEQQKIEKNKIPLAGMTLSELRDVVLAAHMPRFSATQIAQWLYKKRVDSIERMTDLSKQSRQMLSQSYEVGLYPPAGEMTSIDGTVKYLFEVNDKRLVEAVYIPDRDRATLCVSSQAGCRMNCAFCMTGRQGFHGNLTANQIINQVLSIPQSSSLTNIVFMGMGEPLDNIEPVLKSIDILTSKWGLEWSPKRITVSTIGKLDNLRRLLDETKVHIAISVHSPFHTEREELMPVERAYPLTDVIKLLGSYDFTHQRRCSVEYIMWDGLNSDMRHADALARMLRAIPGVRVNLIRFHAIPDAEKLLPCSQRQMEAFRDRLNSLGITATIRASRGEDIMAACGMLAGKLAPQSTTDNTLKE